MQLPAGNTVIVSDCDNVSQALLSKLVQKIHAEAPMKDVLCKVQLDFFFRWNALISNSYCVLGFKCIYRQNS